MKRLFLSLLLLAGMQQSAFAALGAHWTLQDNAANLTIAAAVGTNGTLENAGNTSANSNTPGPGTVYSRYILFDGTNDYCFVTTGNTAVLQNKTQFTLACWFKASAPAATAVLIFVNDGATSNVTRGGINLNTAGTITVAARAADGSSAQSKVTTASYADNTWHHVAGVVDIANDTITIYIDGVSVSTTGTPAFVASATSNTASLSLSIARPGTGANYFPGGLADVRIYDSDESANISTIMAAAGIDKIDPISTSIPGSSKDPLTGTIPGL